MRGRIVLSEDSPTNYRIHEECVSMKYATRKLESRFGVTHGIVEPSKEPVEGHWGIFVIDKASHAAGYPLRIIDLVGIAHNESELSDKTYECSMRYAERIAEACSCVLIDKTARGNETHNLQQEQKLQKSLLEQEIDAEKRHQKTLRNLRERGLDGGSYCVSGNPALCV